MLKIIIDDKYCKGCMICFNACPKDVFKPSDSRSKLGALMPEAKNHEKCIDCKICERLCPEMCISVNKDE